MTTWSQLKLPLLAVTILTALGLWLSDGEVEFETAGRNSSGEPQGSDESVDQGGPSGSRKPLAIPLDKKSFAAWEKAKRAGVGKLAVKPGQKAVPIKVAVVPTCGKGFLDQVDGTSVDTRSRGLWFEAAPEQCEESVPWPSGWVQRGVKRKGQKWSLQVPRSTKPCSFRLSLCTAPNSDKPSCAGAQGPKVSWVGWTEGDDLAFLEQRAAYADGKKLRSALASLMPGGYPNSFAAAAGPAKGAELMLGPKGIRVQLSAFDGASCRPARGKRP